MSGYTISETAPSSPSVEFTKANKAKKLDYKRSVTLFCPNPDCQKKLVYIDASGTRIIQTVTMKDGKTVLKCECGTESWTDTRIL